MIFIAEHWQSISMLAFLAFAGMVLLVHGVRGVIDERNVRLQRLIRENNAKMLNTIAETFRNGGGTSVP